MLHLSIVVVDIISRLKADAECYHNVSQGGKGSAMRDFDGREGSIVVKSFIRPRHAPAFPLYLPQQPPPWPEVHLRTWRSS